ncbi:MFS transporter [Kyrpidia tusciae]|uniref:Major facilitator superfamily MFS_1 n=1 Tax=Kyrpidia tusciae (strain DSM 2912 / NBRC 15312 / T2) TaxID=562970 RepID=D5WVE2_KYRT2|nr:MFS transporter [Kyrpidia tusciae]ADG05552.1 major facilitator superfamily MFS_1 [Kyrpidia tusciae DSM 2912]
MMETKNLVEDSLSIEEKVKSLPEWLKQYVVSPEKQRQLYRKTIGIVIASQIFGGAGLAAGITVGALLAQNMLGTDRYAGIPAALFTLGSAAAAFLVGRLSQRLGRRIGVATGFLAGGIGSIGVVSAAIFHILPLFFISLLVYGAGTATNLQARYAGTDLALPTQRAKAISAAMVFTTFGAVAGPNLVNITGRVATSLGAPALSGPFMLATVAYILAGLALLLFLRPDPLVVAKAIADVERSKENQSTGTGTKVAEEGIHKPGVILGATVMVLTQIVMIAIMTMTPVHMKHYGHGLGEIGLVIGIHIAAMYLPSPITGFLVDKYGRTMMFYISGVTLLLAGLVAAFAPGQSMVLLILALALLGLGWNFGLISGTAAIVDATPPQIRAKTQGTVDVLIALAGSSGGALSGMVVAQSSYATLSLAGGFLSLLLIPVIVWSKSQKKG